MSLLLVDGIKQLACSAVVYLLVYNWFSTIFCIEWTAAYCTKIFERTCFSFNKVALFIKFVTTFTLVFGHFEVQMYTKENTWKKTEFENLRATVSVFVTHKSEQVSNRSWMVERAVNSGTMNKLNLIFGAKIPLPFPHRGSSTYQAQSSRTKPEPILYKVLVSLGIQALPST